MKVALYARVSTDDKDQNPETQLFALRQFCHDAGWEVYQEYVDCARAKDYLHRTAWQQLQKDARLRKFKAVVLFDLTRGWRDTRECLNCIHDWFERGIGVKIIKWGIIDTTTSMGQLILQIFAALAEFESSFIGDRIRAGMARAKAEGHTFGRKMLNIPVNRLCDSLLHNSDIGAAAAELNCSRGYIYQELAKYGVKPKDVIEGRWRPPLDISAPIPGQD